MNYAFPVLAAFLWGGNTIVTKLSAGAISPIEISFYRWLLALLVLTPFLLGGVLRNAAVIRKAWRQLIVLGLLGGVVFQCLAYYAAHSTTAIKMGIIQALYPLLALFLTGLLMKQRTSVATLIGGAISIAGVVLVISNGHFAALFSGGLSVGDAMMLLGTAAFAVYSLLLQRWKIQLPTLQTVYVQAVVATFALLPFFLLTEHHPLTPEVIALVSFAGIGASIGAPLMWIYGIDRLGASRTAPFFNLVPVVTAVLATRLLGEELTGWIAVGGALAIAGVIVSEYWRAKPVTGDGSSQAS